MTGRIPLGQRLLRFAEISGLKWILTQQYTYYGKIYYNLHCNCIFWTEFPYQCTIIRKAFLCSSTVF